MNISISAVGFPSREHLRFVGEDLRDVHRQFGAAVREPVREFVTEMREEIDKNLTRYNQLLAYASDSLHGLARLADQQVFTINGTNWLARYLEAFQGYCEGAELDVTTGALIQAEVLTQCQTILVQDAKTGEIRFVHTEEDADYDIRDLDPSPFRLVEMTIAGHKMTFFAYPGLCSWGPAFGINHSQEMVEMVDDLYIKDKFNRGYMWANAMAFMALDCGDLEIVKQLLERAKENGGGFCGGYAMHFASLGHKFADAPQIVAVEFAHDQVVWEDTVKTPDRSFLVHANCPIEAPLQPLSHTGVPSNDENENFKDAEAYVEMRLRHQRLEAQAWSVDWLDKDAVQSIYTGRQILASPEGDIGGYQDAYGNEHWEYLTGMPSRWTLSHLVGYSDGHHAMISIGKFLPEPIAGSEYSLRSPKNYPHARKKLWLEADRARRAVQQHAVPKHPGWEKPVVIPPKLSYGDEVRIIAPAQSLSTVSASISRSAQKRLEMLGLKVTFGENAYEEDELGSSSVAARLADLHQAFADQKVKAIFSAEGGFNSNQLLHGIDWELIKRNPKILTGYSDITALQNAMLTKVGLVTYSGALFWSIGIDSFYDYTRHYIQRCLFHPEPFKIHPSDEWEDDNGDEGVYARAWKHKGFFSVNEGEAVGQVVGGNLSTFGLLKGTEYFPSLENTILFLEEDYEYDIDHFDRDLQALIQMPGFFGVRGIVCGRFEAGSKTSPELVMQMFHSKPELQGMPIIANVDFGHTYPKITFPIGGTVHILSRRSGSKITFMTH